VTNNALGEEIWWLRGFGWSAPRIAVRLGCHVATVEKHLERGEPDYESTSEALFQIAAGARREARMVYGRTVPQWRNTSMRTHKRPR
jgi:hypothetical protein